mgnify:CR=1 FL=1
MRIGIVCYPTYGGSGVVATELGLALAKTGHQIHFITYKRPARLIHFHENVYFITVRFEKTELNIILSRKNRVRVGVRIRARG